MELVIRKSSNRKRYKEERKKCQSKSTEITILNNCKHHPRPLLGITLHLFRMHGLRPLLVPFPGFIKDKKGYFHQHFNYYFWLSMGFAYTLL